MKVKFKIIHVCHEQTDSDNKTLPSALEDFITSSSFVAQCCSDVWTCTWTSSGK